MKKLFAVLVSALLVLSLVGCKKEEAKPLADDTHAMWNALGQYLLADGTQNGWGDKSAEVFEKSALEAITLEDVKAIDENLYKTLSGKSVKYLYKIDLVFGTNDAGWGTNALINGEVFKANGSYALKIGQCSVETDGDVKVYSVDQWISDPKTAHVESLTPETYFVPVWQEEKDANGFTWADNPVIIGGPGLYTVVCAQYTTVSSASEPGFGIAAVKKEAREGIEYEGKFEATDHTFGVVGSFGWEADVEMVADGIYRWTAEVDLNAGDEFKVRADHAWSYSWGAEDGGNLVAEEAGTYAVTIAFEGETATVTAVKK